MVTAVSTVGFQPSGNRQQSKQPVGSNLLNERTYKGGFRSRTHGAPGQMPGPGGAGAGMEQLGVVQSNLLDGLAFNCWVTFTVTVNIIVISLQQDLCPSGSGPVDCMSFFMLEMLFGMLFLAELVIRIFFTQPKRKFFNDLWNVMDMILIIAAFLDTMVLGPIGIGGTIRYFTVLRALRGIKLVRLVQMFPLFRELWLLVGGLSNSLKALGWVGLIIVMVLYVCGIVVTMEIGKNDDVYAIGPSYDGQVWPYKKYFGTVWRSMFTLFQVLTLDSWCDGIVRHVVYRQPYMGVFFVAFLLLTAFGLINVIIGIIVENTLAAAQVTDRRVEEREAQLRRAAVEHLSVILDKSDISRLGEISLEELKAANNSNIVKEKFEKIGMSFEEIEEIFKLLDYERRGRVELKRLAASCLELVGGAKRRDIAQVEVTIGSLAQHLDSLDTKFSKIESEVQGLTSMAEEFVQTTVRLLTGFDGNEKPSVATADRGLPGRTASTFASG
jgi:voltage-gated sodium channel